MNRHAAIHASLLLTLLALLPLPHTPAQPILRNNLLRIDLRADLSVGRIWILRLEQSATHRLTEKRHTRTTTHRRDLTLFLEAVERIDRDTLEVHAQLVELHLAADSPDASLRIDARNPHRNPFVTSPTTLDDALARTTFRFHVAPDGSATHIETRGPLPALLRQRDTAALNIDAPLRPETLAANLSLLWTAEGALADDLRLNTTWRNRHVVAAPPAGRLVWSEHWRLRAATPATAIMQARLDARLHQSWRPSDHDDAHLRHASGRIITEWDTVTDALAARTEQRDTTITWTIGDRRITESRAFHSRITRLR